MFPKEKTFVAYNFSLQLKFESKTNEVMGTSAEQTAVEFHRQKENIMCTYIKLKYHRSALPGYLGNGMTSLILSIPVAKSIILSKPRPKPQCFTVP